MISKTFKLVTICLLSTAAMAHTHHHTERKLGVNHHHKERKLGGGFSWGQNNASNNNVIAQGVVTAGGNSGSSISAGPAGTVATGYGSNGLSASTLFGQNTGASQNSFGVTNNGNGSANSWGQNAASNNNVFASTNVSGGGNAAFQGASGAFGALSNINADNNSSNNANYVANGGASNNSFGVANNGQNNNAGRSRLLGGMTSNNNNSNCNNNNGSNNNNNNGSNGDSYGWNQSFANSGASKVANSNTTYGNGGSLVSLSKNGVKSENHGTLGTSTKSALQTQQNGWNNSNAFGVSGGKSFGWNAANASNNNSQAFTAANTFGNGGSVTDANNDGVNMMAQGDQGTNTDAGYNNSNDSWANNNGWGKQRLLNSMDYNNSNNNNNNNSNGCNNNNNYEQMYYQTLEKLKKCRQTCGKVGSSQ